MINILIIDDDNDDSEFLRDTIQQISSQTNCTTISSSEEALKGMRTKKIPRPDLIFLDLNMRINGIQCLRELKANASVSEIPVAIYTTSKLRGHNLKSVKLGASHFITK